MHKMYAITVVIVTGLEMAAPAFAQRVFDSQDFFRKGNEQFEREIRNLDRQESTKPESVLQVTEDKTNTREAPKDPTSPTTPPDHTQPPAPKN